MPKNDGTVTIRIHHDARTSTLLGRALGVDRLPVAALRGTDVTEVQAPAGVHILHVRNGLFFSCAVRYAAAPGEVLDYQIQMADDAGLTGAFFGSPVELRRIPSAAPARALDEGGVPLSRVVGQTVTVLP